MADTEGAVEGLTDDEVHALSEWRQGDYSLEWAHFPVVSDTSEDGVEVSFEEVVGWVVATQTCDVVNFGHNKDYVMVCPIIVADDRLLRDVVNGVTPSAAILELRVDAHHVIDLGRAASIHKRVLASLPRKDGFSSDLSRSVFQQSLERRFGRFAFPDWLSTGPLRQLRDRAREKHKTGGPLGDVYKAVDEFRVRGNPDLESNGSAIGFIAVVDAEKEKKTTRKAIRDEFDALSKKFVWPESYIKEDEFFTVMTLDEMTARQLKESHSVDLDFISSVKPPTGQ